MAACPTCLFDLVLVKESTDDSDSDLPELYDATSDSGSDNNNSVKESPIKDGADPALNPEVYHAITVLHCAYWHESHTSSLRSRNSASRSPQRQVER